MLANSILGIATIFQTLAAAYGANIVRLTAGRPAWIVMSIALVLMAGGEAVLLYRATMLEVPVPIDVVTAGTLFTISTLIFIGMMMVNPAVIQNRRDRLAARESETRFRDFALAAADRFWETDAAFCVTYISPPKGGLHLPESAFLGNTLWDVAADRLLDEGLVELRKKFEAHEPVEGVEATYAPTKGEEVCLRYHAVPFYDEDGKFAGYRGVSVDLTGERNARQRYRELFDQANDGIVLIDPHTAEIVDCNEKFAGGYTREEIVGSFAGKFAPGDSPKMLAKRRERLKPGDVEVFERTHTNKDGTTYPVEVSRRLVNIGGRSLILSFVRDISDRRDAAEQMQRSQSLHSTAQALAKSGYFERDLDADEYFYSDTMCEIYGLPPGTTMAFDRFLNMVHSDDRAGYQAIAKKAIEAGEAYSAEFRIIRPNGEQRIVTNHVEVVLDDQNKVSSLIGSVRDITEERERETLFQRSQRLEAMGQLTGGVAHDFNNLLQVMLGSVEQLELKIDPASPARAEIAPLKSAADRASSLTARLLAFSSQQNLAPVDTDIFALIDGIEDMLRRTLGETIELNVQGLRHIWHALIDPHQFENALVNLAVNARDAMPKGGTLTIEAFNIAAGDPALAEQEDMSSEDHVMLVIRDTGVGMSPQVRDKAFEPFFTTKQVGEGSGLGLSMVYGFVKQSRGHVAIESQPGWGTKIRIYFPRSAAPAIRQSAANPALELEQGSERILLVEDDEDVRALPARFLREQGYDVVEARDGVEAMNKLDNNETFDLLFTDVVLPGGMNGVEIAQKAKSLRRNLKVLYTTGYAEDTVADAGHLKEGVNLVKKPYRRTELLTKVREILDNAPA